MINEFLRNQADYIYFISGLGFFLLAASSLLLHGRKEGNIPWKWLGLFGITHAVAQWLEMLTVGFGDNAEFQIIRLIPLTCSYIFLFLFGLTGRSTGLRRKRAIWIVVILPLIAMLGIFGGLSGASIAVSGLLTDLSTTVRYAFGLFGGLLAGQAIWQIGQSSLKQNTALRINAIVLMIYSVSIAVLAPKAGFFPASVLNYDTFSIATGIFPPILTAILSLLLAESLWHSYLTIYNTRSIQAKGTYRARYDVWMILVMLATLVGGWIGAEHMGNQYDLEKRENLLGRAKIAAAAINPRRIISLACDSTDLRKSDCLRLREQMTLIQRSVKDIRYFDLIRIKSGKTIFAFCSAREDSPEYERPDQEYIDVPPQLRKTLDNGEPCIIGPYKNSHGVLISSYAPIRDIGTAKILGVLASNFDAAAWISSIALERLEPIIITLLIIMIQVIYLIKRHRQMEASEKLRASEEKYRAIIETSQDWIWEINNEAIYTYSNPMVEQILGYTPQELQGRNTLDFIHPDDKQKAMEIFERSFAVKQGWSGMIFHWRHKDGSSRWMESNAVALRGANGQFMGLRGTDRDITARKMAEERLAQSQRELSHTVAMYTAMINTAPTIMYLKDINHKYLAVNDAFCKKIGKSAADIIGKSEFALFPPGRAEINFAEDTAVMNKEIEIFERIEQVQEFDLTFRWTSTTKIPLMNEEGTVWGMVGLVGDVTEQHVSRQKLAQSDKLAAIGTLAAGVAHEINNPIGYISSNLNTMKKYLEKIREHLEKRDEPHEEDHKQIMDMVVDFNDAVNESIEGAARVKNIVADLKSFSRIDRAEKECANLNDGINSTLNIIWNELKYKCTVEKDFGILPELYCIPNQLNQVFMNILINAGHAITEEHGTILIKTWADDNNILISIKDDGCGIPKENLRKIFEPFFTTKEVGKGTGLGLSLAYDIVRKHGGNIEVKSEVEIGTEFTITLPLEGLSKTDKTDSKSLSPVPAKTI